MKVTAVKPALDAVIQGPPRSTYHRSKLSIASSSLAIVVHVIVILYLVMWIGLCLLTTDADLKATKFLWPKTALVTYIVLVVAHVYMLVSLHGPSCRPFVFAKRTPSLVNSSSIVSSFQAHARRVTLFADLYDSEFVILFNVVELACQSHQAMVMLQTSSELATAMSYAALVILYSFVSPWILFIRNKHARTSVNNLADTLFSFCLSCGHPMVATVLPLLDYLLFDVNLQADNLWCTRVLLLGRVQSISNAFDYFCKLGMHVGTLLALSRLGLSANHVLPHKEYQSPRRRLFLRINAVATTTLACVATVAVVVSQTHRHACPSYCVADVHPLFDKSCQCVYADLNCHVLQMDDPTPLLNTTIIGSSLFYLQISRCSVPQGLPSTALAPFTDIYRLLINFSNLQSWTGPLPPSLNSLVIRYSQLAAIPDALLVNVPPSLRIIYLDSCSLGPLPDAALAAWGNIQKLYVINASLQSIPATLAASMTLLDVNFGLNNLTTLPPDWLDDATSLRQLYKARFPGNPLAVAPWSLAQRSLALDLSSTLVAKVPSGVALTKRRVVLDDTPYCSASTTSYCQPLCAPACFSYLRGNKYCNLACFNAACAFDGGDCDGLALDRS
ncbi:Aste57867_13309 [Aphanomyces stellatus]|uniref:Aste57867_13309 protein n=1 Tax=Aphanomyces stellatus TaxID=120398 RepID=A0A485KYM9_9STRA|nr:hypothetical protein As57867_013260 [Aphanomyces stellatus]VFT90148.1 Aste57867_13309 [Aphanomyces stellatus]